MWQFLRAAGFEASSFLVNWVPVKAFLLAGAVCSVVSAATVESAGNGYVVVTDVAVSQEAGWQEVLASLQDVHNATVVTYRGDVRESLLELAARAPDYVAFLVPPEQAKPSQVWVLHRMMRELDDDPYTDALWGIVTGYTPADALRIVRHRDPLIITRGASGTGGKGSLNPFQAGFATDEGKPHAFCVKENDQITETEEQPDCIAALAAAFRDRKPQCFLTSGHATPDDWQVGYTYRGGQFRCKDGQLYGLDTQGKRYDINSPEPKIYMPVGNCLIGAIPNRNAMALAWMHSGGVHQMFGYTVVTWFGYGGWGVKDLFMGQSGRFCFSEAVFLNNQALLHKLQTEHARYANLQIPDYDHRRMNSIFGRMVQRHGITGDVKSVLGLLWDRDVVAFYGDPAWEARMPQPAEALPWTQRFSETERTTTFTITTTAAGNWPSRPVMARLPTRLDNVRIVEGSQFKPVVTDNFILVPLVGEFQAGETIQIVFEGTPRLPDHDGLKKAEAVLKGLPADVVSGLRYALGRAGANRAELVAALAAVGTTNDPGECDAKLKAMAFLITHMPRSDLRSLDCRFLVDHVDGAWLARTKAPWKAEISDELFLDGILPYACLDEQRDAWRQTLQKRFAERAWRQASAGEAACWLNRTIFKELNVRYHAAKRPKPNQNASESIEAGFASCTGLSILLVDACRACGIPARIAGIPAWKVANTDGKGQHGGNHNWVEIYHDGSWHCLGGGEDSPLDKTWFLARIQEASDAGQWQHSVYATTWQDTDLTFPMVWNLPNTTVSAKNVTSDYIRRIEGL